MALLAFYPIDTPDTGNLAEMLGVVCYYCQAKVASSDGNQDVKIANNNALAGECLPYFGIVTSPVDKWQDCKCISNFLGLLEMPFHSLTVKNPISKFGNRNFRCKDFISRCLGNMLVNTSTMTEIFYPSVRI